MTLMWIVLGQHLNGFGYVLELEIGILGTFIHMYAYSSDKSLNNFAIKSKTNQLQHSCSSLMSIFFPLDHYKLIVLDCALVCDCVLE